MSHQPIEPRTPNTMLEECIDALEIIPDTRWDYQIDLQIPTPTGGFCRSESEITIYGDPAPGLCLHKQILNAPVDTCWIARYVFMASSLGAMRLLLKRVEKQGKEVARLKRALKREKQKNEGRNQ